MSAMLCSFSEGFPSNRQLRFGLWSEDDAQWLQLMQQLYNAHAPRLMAPHPPGEQERIPRIIHHCWLGGELPPAFAQLIDGWRQLHPTWEMKLWGEDDVAGLQLKNQQAFDEATNPGMKSDIMRYEILLQHGGVYIDVDFVGLKSLDLFVQNLDFFTGLSNTGSVEINNGLIGCCPGHPALAAVVNAIAASAATTRSQGVTAAGGGRQLAALLGTSALGGFLGASDTTALQTAVSVSPAQAKGVTGTIIRTGPGKFTQCVMEYAAQNWNERHRFVVFPPTFFYPVPNTETDALQHYAFEGFDGALGAYLSPHSFAVHLWWVLIGLTICISLHLVALRSKSGDMPLLSVARARTWE
ncbi:unnamed protein product [Chrysoparadoxa australica]